MKILRNVALVLAVLALLTVGTAIAGAEPVTTNERVPFDMWVFVPCANGGAGESVHLTGTLHVLFHTTVDGAGGFHSKSHFQPQGVSGVGEITGDTYRATGVTQDEFNGKVGSVSTYVNNFRIIGQGPGNNYLVHQTFHVTVNAKGEVTAFVDNFSVECK